MKRTKSKMHQQRPPRGVVLLVVLSLLVLFMVLTVTFVVVTGHYKRNSQSYHRIRRTSSQNTARTLADNVVYQLLRDTRTSSALRNQSLLGDLYGNDGFLGFVVNSQAQGGGQFLELTAQIDPRNRAYSQIDSLVRNGVMPDGCFNGRVLTIVDSVWMPGPDGRWGQAAGPNANDDGFGLTNDVREAGFANSDDLTIGSRMWTQGNDLQWGRAGTDDDGDGVNDNFPEAGYAGSDDLPIPFTDPGADDRWGRAGVNDDGDAVTDNGREANWPGSDDRRVSPVASTRVVKSVWQRNPTNLAQIVGVTLLVEAFADIPVHNQIIPTLAQRFVINGAPFNGTGIGYHPSTQGLDLNVPVAPGADGGWGVAATDDDQDGTTDERDEAGFPGSDDLAFPMALAQNFSSYRQGTFLGVPFPGAPLASVATPDFAGWTFAPPLPAPQFPPIPNATAGGTDESYDVPDYQNMYLSATVPMATSAADVIPSFHRPEMVNYLFHWVVSNLFWDPSGSWWVNPPDHWGMFIAPMGLDGKPGTGDEPPANANWPPTYRQLVRDLKRWCIFRPLPDEHPNFVSPADRVSWIGNSGNSRLIFGPYDVDNDGDGIPESVWVDAGLPPVRLPDGRQVKPMVAMQVEDLDNRFDLNAVSGLENNVVQHSTSFQFHPGRDARWGWAGVDDNGDGITDDIGEAGMRHPTTNAPSDDARIAGTTNVAGIARGLGIGPAEISLRPLFVDPDNNTGTSTSNASFPGDMLGVINDRYRRIGSAMIVPGQNDGSDDELSIVRDFHLPIQYWNPVFAKTSYSTPSDLRGLGATLLDFNGQAIHAFAGRVNEVVDDPYELGIGGDSYRGRTGGDNTLTINDLERLLRWSDPDIRLVSSRLADLAPDVFKFLSARRLVTTLSSHVPAPPLSVPADLRNLPITPTNYWKNRPGILGITAVTQTTAPTIADMFYARFAQGGMAVGNFAAQLNLMLPPELQKGQRFDVNRPFGNGRDDDGDGVVDDPLEPIDLALSGIASSTIIRELAWPNPGQPNYQFSTVAPTISGYPQRWFNGSNALSVRIDTSVAPNQNYVDWLSDPARYRATPDVRQIYARHLYCMMMLLVDTNFLPPTAETLTALQKQEELARRVAQWAVNVVDFRDPDSIMTPFEYDFLPFNGNGWSVDGIVGAPRTIGADGIWGTADDGWGTADHLDPMIPKPDRRLVWGCESPDLLLTETVAVHDRCVKDTDQDNGMAMNKSRGPMMGTDDDDLDQFRKPIGSLFLELYCPRNPVRIGPQYGNTVALPAELYNAAGNLDLTRLAPVRPNAPLAGIQHPVWRVAISPESEIAPGDDAISAYSTVSPDTPTFSPGTAVIERMIWFAPLIPTTHPEASMVFYGRSGNVVLPPNRYAVIGPRTLTAIGSKDDDGNFTNPYDFSLPHKASTHVINLAGGTVTTTDNRNPPGADYTYPVVGTAIQPPVSIICAANPPASWLGVPGTYSIGMNVSEPLPQLPSYYPPPLDFTTNSYYGGAGTLYDTPFDEDSANFSNSPLATPTIDVATGTRPNNRGIYLQRLADPTHPWNPEPPDPNHDSRIPCNPYITVDFASVDLTVFSGDEQTNRSVMGGAPLDPNDPTPYAVAPSELFQTRERGGDVGGSGNPYNLFSAYTMTPAATAAAPNADATMYFKHRLLHSLGYLNTTFGTPLQSGATVGNSFVPPESTGAPSTPFPWFTWLDRPFANPYELLLVPSSSPSRLLYEYVGTGLTGNPSTSAQHPVIPNTGLSPYLSSSTPPPLSPNNWRAPYAHLLNFFHGSMPGNFGADLSRLFDLIETSSPFVNSHRWYNPVVAETAATANWPSILDGFRPPHNRQSRFRDPGRININTIYDQRVWDGICDLFPNLQGQWSDMVTSRRGYSVTGIDPRYPSRFNNPFRAALASDLMPNTGYYLRDQSSGAVIAPPVGLRVPSSEATLLRTDPTVAGPNPAPLFDNNADTALTERHAPRNPFFRYQGVARLSNLVTNHSNVFAVRMTIGYFELEPWVNAAGAVIRDDAHPEGLAIGQEVGSDTGSVKRERSFFIIDRSIPVGFEPDENHNVDKAILVRRYIN